MYIRILFVLISIAVVRCLDNGLGLTPQMGWNSWNHFGCNINENLIKRTADLLVSTGLAQKGYNYLNLDDCWQIARNETTKEIIEDKTKFPSGIKSLAQYVHSKGLKFGLYSDAGEKTCEGRPGSYGYEKLDAKTYANWEVDYLKYDNCYNLNVSAKIRYFAMYKALNESGRHIYYSMCNWGEDRSWEWAGPYANSWRTTGDIKDNWKSFTSILDQQVGLQVYAGKGGWNDPDMLQVGNGGMTFDEYYSHFTLWAILKAPLLIGCSLQNISSDTLKILGNEQLIAINQDSLGIQASRLRKDVKVSGTTQIWGGELSGNRFVLVFFNKGELTTQIKFNIREELKKNYDNYAIRDAIKHQDLGIRTSAEITASVNKHSVQALILKFYKNSKQNKQQNSIQNKQQLKQIIDDTLKQETIKQIQQQNKNELKEDKNFQIQKQIVKKNDNIQKQEQIKQVKQVEGKVQVKQQQQTNGNAQPKITNKKLKKKAKKQKEATQVIQLQNKNNIGNQPAPKQEAIQKKPTKSLQKQYDS